MQSKKNYILFGLVCTVFGSTFLAISLGLKAGASPLFFAALRFCTAGTILLPLALVKNRLGRKEIFSLISRSAMLSLFLTVGTFGFMFLAQTKVSSGFMARLDATGPLITALLAALLLGKKLRLMHFIAFAMGTAGSFLIASPAESSGILYLIFAAASVILYAAGNAIYPLLFKQEEDPILVSALQSLTGGIILLVLALSTETIQFPAAAIGPLIYLILGGSVIGHTATLILVRDAGPVFASSWLYVSPAVATLLGVIILNESVTPGGITGTLLALTGVFILDRAENRKIHSQENKNH